MFKKYISDLKNEFRGYNGKKLSQDLMAGLTVAAVALPLYQSGQSKLRAFVTGVLSGAVEPLFGVLVVLAAARVHALMPWLLSFAAGAMLYVVAEELLPRAGNSRGTCGFFVGFLFMMVLDVALG